LDPVVIKIGGSIASNPQALRKLCNKLGELSKIHQLVVVPGGGEFADTVRHLDEQFNLTPVTTHRMAILGMEQYGLMLCDLITNCQTVVDPVEVQEALNQNRIPIFLPYDLVSKASELESSWDVTSDSIALFLAGKLHSTFAIMATDVDGIFTSDPKMFPGAKLIERMSADELLGLDERTAVDRFFPKLLRKMSVKCFVVNGLNPDRIEAILNNEDTICTIITSS